MSIPSCGEAPDQAAVTRITPDKRRRGRLALWESGREDDDYIDLYNMLKLANGKPIKPYSLAREVFHRKVVLAREYNPNFRFYGDELVHIKRLGNKLKALLDEAEVSLFFKDFPNGYTDDDVAGYCRTEEEKRQEALQIIFRLIAEPYETDLEGNFRSESELWRMIEGWAEF